MNSIAIASIAFACMFGGALLGAFIRKLLAPDYLNSDARDVVKLGAGLIATLAALVLGLMVSSAKGMFDSINDGLTQAAASFSDLDRVLDQYGPETDIARAQLRQSIASSLQRVWPKTHAETVGISVEELSTEIEMVGDSIRRLTPKDES